jgi:methionine biosynthesis protein MetW
LRKDLALMADLLPVGSRVLDLGCGNGDLLEYAFGSRSCTGIGVEIEPEAVLEAIRRGIPVIELDIDQELDQFGENSYDVVVLSRTIQTIRRPQEVLRGMSRIGRRLMVSIPNFGWWGHRLRLLRGRMPMSRELPYKWYNTPNLRFTTLSDIEDLFAECGMAVEQRIALSMRGDPLRLPPRWANLFAGASVYVLRSAD